VLIIDDRLISRALLQDYSWIPDGNDSQDLATTAEFHFRLVSGTLQHEPIGVHSKRFAQLPQLDQERFRERMFKPDQLVRILDSRMSLNVAAAIFAGYGQLSMMMCHALAAASINDAEVAFTVITPAIQFFCSEAGIPLHHITS
jgi:hypothetical protein